MLLRLEQVGKRYGGRLVLRAVNLEIHQQETVLLVGANGCGKSTLLRLMSGLTEPSSGYIQSMVDSIGYLGHGTGLYPSLTALENLAFWQRLHRRNADPGKLKAALDAVGLERRGNDKAGSFSRGMAQRLNLARTLLMEPDLLLLDEPGTGLDAAGTVLLHDAIQQARLRGAGIVWVSHDVDRDALHAERMLALGRQHRPVSGYSAGSTILYDGPPAAYEGASPC